jgi:hypothetical protein
MPKDGLQFFQFHGRGCAKHALTVETSIRDQNVTVGIEAEKVAECLDGDDAAGDRIPFGDDLLHEDPQGFPGAATQIVEKMAIIEKISAQDLRDAQDEMPVGNLFEHMRAYHSPNSNTRF